MMLKLLDRLKLQELTTVVMVGGFSDNVLVQVRRAYTTQDT